VKYAHSCGPAEKFWVHWPHKIPGHEDDGIESSIQCRIPQPRCKLWELNLQGVKGYPERFSLTDMRGAVPTRPAD